MAKTGVERLGNVQGASVKAHPDDTTEEREKQAFGDYDYTIFLINMGSAVFQRACYNFDPDGSNRWFGIPRTPHNCDGDCDSCHDSNAWRAIMNVDCRESSINLTVASVPDEDGSYWAATFDNLQTNCDYAGGSICTG